MLFKFLQLQRHTNFQAYTNERKQ